MNPWRIRLYFEWAEGFMAGFDVAQADADDAYERGYRAAKAEAGWVTDRPIRRVQRVRPPTKPSEDASRLQQETIEREDDSDE